jgi:hypothetical protein
MNILQRGRYSFCLSGEKRHAEGRALADCKRKDRHSFCRFQGLLLNGKTADEWQS